MGLLKTLESPLDSKIKAVNPKGNQPWVFTGRNDAEAEAPILWLPDAKSWLIGKDSDAGKDWGWEEKQVTDNQMVGWHQWFNDMNLSKLWETVKDSEAWCATVHGVTKSQTQLIDWTIAVSAFPRSQVDLDSIILALVLSASQFCWGGLIWRGGRWGCGLSYSLTYQIPPWLVSSKNPESKDSYLFPPVLISLWRVPCHITHILNKSKYLCPAKLCLFNFQIQPRTLRGSVKENLFLPSAPLY